MDHRVKSVHIPSFSGPYFPAFVRMQYIQTRKTPHTDTSRSGCEMVIRIESHF